MQLRKIHLFSTARIIIALPLLYSSLKRNRGKGVNQALDTNTVVNPTYVAIESEESKVPKDGEEANVGVEGKADLGSPGTA